MGKYDGLSREQLVELLEKRDREKKLGLVWERDEIEADQAIDANFVAPTLEIHLSDKPAPWRNLVIEGDNFDALRWLRMAYAHRVKCIYVDPPYNTGANDWVYNDRYFDKDDRFRFSTWIEFLYRRFALARDLLTEDGVIFVSINDDNRSLMELMLDEVMPGMRIGSIVWRTKDSANGEDRNFSAVHEHVLVYGAPRFSFLGSLVDHSKYVNRDCDLRGDYSLDPLTQPKTRLQRENGYYPIFDSKTGWWYPCNPDSVWRLASEQKITKKTKLRSETIESLIEDNRIYFTASEYVEYNSIDEIMNAIENRTVPADGKGRPLLRVDLPDLAFWVGKKIGLGRPWRKSFWSERQSMYRPVSSLSVLPKEEKDSEFYQIIADKQGVATDEVQKIFGNKVFNYPKPVSLIASLINSAMGREGIVLDFFAGSATTAQAVMELNAEDEGQRRFIMVSSTEATTEEPGKNICRDITSERIRRLNHSDDEKYAALAAEFAYLKCREIRFEDLDQDITPQEVWTSIEAIHDLPLTVYEPAALWQENGTPGEIVIYADKVADELFDRIDDLLKARANLFVYVWAPGQLARYEGRDVEVRQVREALVKRFQQ
ncbi:site-specific DNA-methyltransferase [Pleomorphomonas sp. JP5]|uniref:site-specific DNA-methyltransferase n=1 Tax=Pleomorphomonas sp. JP5 TaxID=2942998 RepID=UPI0020434E18|nr:site-specific DNA-methyltransferase [Pleomorphomonas sp. JP5]MCM5560288.1 site-specific DNA-methyltransferase [Pleomorphomonas sp. JP5]